VSAALPLAGAPCGWSPLASPRTSGPGLTTLIGTPPNILVNQALVGFDIEPFAFFDYALVGVPVMLAGVAFMVLLGRHLLPSRDITKESTDADLGMIFGFQERMCFVQIGEGSELAGRTLAANRLGAALGLNVLAIIREDDMTHLALLDQARHGADGILDRHLRVHSMQVVEVDDLNAKPSQTGLTGFLNVRWASIEFSEASISSPDIAEFGRQNDFLAPAFDRTTHQFLIAPASVHICRVKKVYSKVQCPADRGDGFLIIASAIEGGHSHTSKTQRGDLQTASPKRAFSHTLFVIDRNAVQKAPSHVPSA